VPLVESRLVTLSSGHRLSLVLVREARALFLRPDGRCVATVLPAEGQSAGEQPRDLVIFDISRPEALHRRPLAEGAFLSLSPRSDGPIVTTASGDLEFRDVNSGKVNRVVSWSEDPVNGVVFSGDGRPP
jgi:WD40 repeat protein